MGSEKELLEKADRLRERCMRILDLQDPEQIMAYGEEMKAEAAEFESAMLAWEAEFNKQYPQKAAVFEVVLTPEQRQRIQAATGVSMETVLITDDTGERNAAMVMTRPGVIEAEAMRQAQRRKLEGPAKREIKAFYAKAFAELEGQSEAMAELVKTVLADPKVRAIMGRLDEK